MDLSVKSWFDVVEFSFLPTPISDKTVMFSWDKYSAVFCTQGFLFPPSFALTAGIIINALLCSGGNCETGSREFLSLSC